MSRKSDFLSECMDSSEFRGPIEAFKEAYCKVCQNSECTHSLWGESKWLARMIRQEEAIYNPQFVDPSSDPLYAEIARQEFISIADKEVKIYGGWVDIQEDGRIVHLAEPDNEISSSEKVEKASHALAKARTGEEGGSPSFPPEKDETEVIKTPEPEPEPSPEFKEIRVPKKFQAPKKEGIMIGGSSSEQRPSDLKKESSFLLNQPDPWALPPEKGKVGGGGTGKMTVRIGDGKVIKRE